MTNLELLIKHNACEEGIKWYKENKYRLDVLVNRTRITVNDHIEFSYLQWAISEKLIINLILFRSFFPL